MEGSGALFDLKSYSGIIIWKVRTNIYNKLKGKLREEAVPVGRADLNKVLKVVRDGLVAAAATPDDALLYILPLLHVTQDSSWVFHRSSKGPTSDSR